MKTATSPPLCFQSALQYAREGFAVFPIQAAGKAPLTAHGVKDASKNPKTIEDWWRRWPKANIGIAVPAGFLVLDIDSPDALQQLKATDRELPSTACALTSRGRHLWYRPPGRVRNRVAVLPGIDVRAEGGYVVAPPSQHSSGAVYSWQTPLRIANIAESPDWVSELLATPRQGQKRDWTGTILNPVPCGQRNQTLASVAGLLFRRLDAPIAAELACVWAAARLDPPLSDEEVLRTINSIAQRELRRWK